MTLLEYRIVASSRRGPPGLAVSRPALVLAVLEGARRPADVRLRPLGMGLFAVVLR